MIFPKILSAVLLTSILLVACSPAKAPVKYSMAQATSTGCATPEPGKTGTCKVNAALDSTAVPTQGSASQVEPTVLPTSAPTSQSDLTKSDEQGSVTVALKPLNLDQPGDALVFDVVMTTHMVDLSMDLTSLAVLSTDTGKTVQAAKWDGPRGGHHVEGKLSFPTTQDGKSLLDGANSITITIKDVDAPSRTFKWQLKG